MCPWESISYGEILIVVCDGWRVRLPRHGEFEDDVRSLKLPRRNLRHIVEGPHCPVRLPGPEDGAWPWGQGAEWTWALNHIAVGNLGERHIHELGLMDWFSVLLCTVVISSVFYFRGMVGTPQSTSSHQTPHPSSSLWTKASYAPSRLTTVDAWSRCCLSALKRRKLLPISLYDALILAAAAWCEVTPQVIGNCFRKGGFINTDDPQPAPTAASPDDADGSPTDDRQFWNVWDSVSRHFGVQLPLHGLCRCRWCRPYKCPPQRQWTDCCRTSINQCAWDRGGGGRRAPPAAARQSHPLNSRGLWCHVGRPEFPP